MKRILFISVALLLIGSAAFSQKRATGISPSKYVKITRSTPSGGAVPTVSGGTSESKFVSIRREVNKIPGLVILKDSTRYIDFNGDNTIDGNETFTISLKMFNRGPGPGLGMKALVTEMNGLRGLSFSPTIHIGDLDSGRTATVDIPVFGSADLLPGNALFVVSFKEARSLGPDPVEILVPTRAFREPDVRVSDIACRDSLVIARKQPFKVEFYVQNFGYGPAMNVEAKFILPKDILEVTGKKSFTAPVLDPGQSIGGDIELVIPGHYASDTVPVWLRVTEKFGLYSRDTVLRIRIVKHTEGARLVAQAKKTGAVADINRKSFGSEVDRNIPNAGTQHPNRLALVIGNEDYSRDGSAFTNVDYALNDALIFQQYAIRCMGIPAENCLILKNGTRNDMITKLDELSERAKRRQGAEIILYYAGHGQPDRANDGAPYLMPVDGDAGNTKTLVQLAEVYGQLAESGAARVTVFLDACFSGGGRGKDVYAYARAGARTPPRTETIKGSMVVFAATSGDQVSNPYHAEKHGLFTYYLLKKLQESSGKCHYGELSDYLKDNVFDKSFSVGSRQEPSTQTSEAIAKSWREWGFE